MSVKLREVNTETINLGGIKIQMSIEAMGIKEENVEKKKRVGGKPQMISNIHLAGRGG